MASAVPAAFVVGFILWERGIHFPWHVSAGSFVNIVWRKTREVTLMGLLFVVTPALIVVVVLLTDALSSRPAVAAFVGLLVALWLLLRLTRRRR